MESMYTEEAPLLHVGMAPAPLTDTNQSPDYHYYNQFHFIVLFSCGDIFQL